MEQMKLSEMKTNDELITEQLRTDPEFRAEWERTALARAVAVAIVRYRAEHDLSQRDLAGRLGMKQPQVARLELGEINPSMDTLMRLSAELGMFGIIAITDEHTPRVDREIYLFFHDLYSDDIPELSQDFDCFNGRAYIGNTPVFTARVGERVRWRIAALGKEFHVFHLHGHRWFNGQIDTDSQILGPSTTLTVEYTEDNPGEWLYHCHVTDHMQGGMMGLYKVHR